MKSVKLNRIISLALAFVFCAGAMAFPSETVIPAEASGYNEPIVRVGMYAATTTDSRLFSAKTESASGFDIGISDGSGFTKLFSLSYAGIIILPQVNASYDPATGKCVAGEGNIGAYSVTVSKHTSYSEAAKKANAAGGFVAVVSGGYEVRTSPSASAEALKGKAVAAPADGGLMILDLSGNILLTYEDNTRKFALRGSNGGNVKFPMLHRTGAMNTYEYMGFFEYSVSGGKLFMVNCLGLEEYTKCIMANEIGTNVSKETRKAFSVLARTVPLAKKHNADGFDVCTHSACCQVYSGLHQMGAENNEIVDSTRGIYCAYNGSPISVLYHNSNGGASCSSVAAWGGDEIPYLTTVFLDEDGESDTWELSFTKSEFFEYIQGRYKFSGISDDEISMKILETDPYGSEYITVLSVSDGSGNSIEVRNSEEIRSACGFDSANFKLEYTSETLVATSDGKSENRTVSGVLTADGYKEFEGFGDEYESAEGDASVAPDKVTISGEGAGHGVGFSAIGSEKLAADGYSYEYILQFFFNGTKLINLY